MPGSCPWQHSHQVQRSRKHGESTSNRKQKLKTRYLHVGAFIWFISYPLAYRCHRKSGGVADHLPFPDLAGAHRTRAAGGLIVSGRSKNNLYAIVEFVPESVVVNSMFLCKCWNDRRWEERRRWTLNLGFLSCTAIEPQPPQASLTSVWRVQCRTPGSAGQADKIHAFEEDSHEIKEGVGWHTGVA